MATSHDDNHHVDTLPPSPPPSPPNTRRRHPKRKHDAFDELPITPVPSPPASPPNELAEDETMWTRVVVAPVMFTSFLLSLFLVDFRERTRRTRGRPMQTSFFSYFSPTYWLDPEPYQDPDDATWSRDAAGHVEPHDSLNPDQSKEKKHKKKGSWHLNKKIRKVARLEISDAFEMRGRVVVGMVTVMLIGGMAVWMGGRWIVTSLSHSWHRSRAKI